MEQVSTVSCATAGCGKIAICRVCWEVEQRGNVYSILCCDNHAGATTELLKLFETSSGRLIDVWREPIGNPQFWEPSSRRKY